MCNWQEHCIQLDILIPIHKCDQLIQAAKCITLQIQLIYIKCLTDIDIARPLRWSEPDEA